MPNIIVYPKRKAELKRPRTAQDLSVATKNVSSGADSLTPSLETIAACAKNISSLKNYLTSLEALIETLGDEVTKQSLSLKREHLCVKLKLAESQLREIASHSLWHTGVRSRQDLRDEMHVSQWLELNYDRE